VSPLTHEVIAINQRGVTIMAMNRIQFQPGLSMPEFLTDYGIEAQCEQALEVARWPEGYCCPRCAGTAHSVVRDGPRMPAPQSVPPSSSSWHEYTGAYTVAIG